MDHTVNGKICLTLLFDSGNGAVLQPLQSKALFETLVRSFETPGDPEHFYKERNFDLEKQT